MVMATRDAYGEFLVHNADELSSMVVLDCDLASATKTGGFAAKYPERFFNFGIAEQNMMGAAAGLAASGLVPFASGFAGFVVGRCFDQIRQSIAYSQMPVEIVGSHAGITVGEDGATHQCLEDIGLMKSLPNMTVLVPADARQTKACLRAAYHHDGPVYIRVGRVPVPNVTLNDDFVIGEPTVVRSGADVTVAACGLMVGEALKAAESLAGQGISLEVINVSTVRPLNVQPLLRSVKKTGRLLTVEEHSVFGGMGETVASELLRSGATFTLESMGMRTFGETGDAHELMAHFGLDAAGITKTVTESLARN